MGELVIIHEHALIHGLDPDEVEYAWRHYLTRLYRGAPNEDEVVALGYGRNGKLMELVGTERSFGTVVFHAMVPPTRKVLAELGLERS